MGSHTITTAAGQAGGDKVWLVRCVLQLLRWEWRKVAGQKRLKLWKLAGKAASAAPPDSYLRQNPAESSCFGGGFLPAVE
jgi:hypothetical protein